MAFKQFNSLKKHIIIKTNELTPHSIIHYPSSKQQILNKQNQQPKYYSGTHIHSYSMKTKKKPNTPKHPPPIKLLNVKTLQPEKHHPFSSQKPYLTIEENTNTFQYAETDWKKEDTKTRFSFGKKSYNQRMEEHNLSPFSNDGRSASPKYRKTPQKLLSKNQDKQVKFAINLKELQKKKLPPKPKVQSARDTFTTKKSITPSHTKTIALTSVKQQPQVPKKKPSMKKKKSDKSDKEEKARIEFQNQFLSMMNNRIHKQKITEMSDEEGSIRKKKPALQICIQTTQNNSSREDRKLKEKKDLVKTMQIKVMKDTERDYPNLDATEKKVICAVIIIQRLWRQRKVKQFFQHYVTPKASPECSFRDSLQKDSSNSTMNLLAGHMGRKDESKSWEVGQVPKKKHSVPVRIEDNFLIRQKSQEEYPTFTQIKSRNSTQAKLNQKVNKMLEESILSFENQNEKIINESSSIDQPSMMKFIECYREIKLSGSKNKPKTKRNVFSLKESLSEKCLMQKYYTRIFSDKPDKNKPKNYELFSLNNSGIGKESLKQNQQSSIELFKDINKNQDYLSPQKLLSKEEEEVWVRNETSYGQDDSDELKEKEDVGSFKVVDEREGVAKVKMIGDEIVFAEGFFGKDLSEIKTQSFLPQIMLSPKKLQLQEDQTANQNDNHEQCGIVINKSPKALQASPNKQPFSQVKQKPEYSLKSIQGASESILNQLLSQFFTQYMAFQQKQCLVKKQRHKKQQQKDIKPKLPGIQISPQTINDYLNILIPYIFTIDREQVLKSLELFHPSSYQKCHRVQSVIYELFQFADEQEDDEIYWTIITNQGFLACLEEYFQKNITLPKDKEKFTHFVNMTSKVYNRCITDTFSQTFNKQALEKTLYPWSSKNQHNKILFSPHAKTLQNPEILEIIAEEIKQKILKLPFCYSTTGGKLIKKDIKPKPVKKEFQFGDIQKEEYEIEKLSDEEYTKVMKIADDQFLQDERDSTHVDWEKYEICAGITEAVLGELMQEIQQEIMAIQKSSSIIQDPIFMKSQNEIFLQTNDTLEKQ